MTERGYNEDAANTYTVILWGRKKEEEREES